MRVAVFNITRIILGGFTLVLIWACSSDFQSFDFQLEPGSNREIAYTDKQDAHWVTRAGGYNSSPWHGLTALKRGYLEDLFISVEGVLLPREEALVTITPASLIRSYPSLGIRETWTLLDEKRVLLVELEAEQATHWTVQPAILGGNQPADFEISKSEQELNVILNRMRVIPSSYPHLKIWFSQAMSWLPAEAPDLPLYSAYLTPRADYSASHRLAIAVSLSKEAQEMDLEPGWMESARSLRQQRIDTRATSTEFQSNLPELDKAIFWAHHSLDALVMKQVGKGIYAGLPWFDDYWGRDAFISFTGAVLVSGQYEDARQILLSFADLQNKDEFDPDYGRVPNRAQPDNIIYNTTDGTPWFVRSVWDYYRYSNDAKFLQKMWPAIRRATEGSLMNWVDGDGLLRHADADTWMDAKGPDGPWSPRGDRAIDIQFIWRDQLEITRRLAQKYGDIVLVEEIELTLNKCNTALEKYRSAEDGFLVDHLNADDSQDHQIRPNVFLVPRLFHETCDWATFEVLAPQLITRKGVLSLAQDDSNFHPYHLQPGLYVKDAAYHNGIIWTWNSAATITPAIQFHQYHYAEALFNDLTQQIIERGAIGTIAELTDGWPREGELQLSGTFSQAWSLAEYLRSFYQDILGIQPDLSEAHVTIAPRLLKNIREVIFKHPIGEDQWEIEYQDSESQFDIHLSRAITAEMNLSFELFVNDEVTHLDLSWKQTDLHLQYEKQMGQWTVPGDAGEYMVTREAIVTAPNSLAFCELDTTRKVPALMGPEHRLLSEKELIRFSTTSKSILKLSDAEGDDHGLNSRFTYPSNPQFEVGLADILEFEVSQGVNYYEFEFTFSNLVDPGWHPEYGYQLTYCAIGISYNPTTGTNDPGKNSQAKFQAGFKADQIMYISGGVLLVDSNHQPEAEYMPGTVAGAIGNAETDQIKFSLPRDLFPVPLQNATFQIAVGCQDDHGGAGIGDFRPVEAEGAEWNGGGGSAGSSNVYDWLID
ncbi:MAG: hypothetical protein HOD43_05695 [Candidatus Marinimicrobia bacterium]|jgi:glycogen debranching enzyme|nr:hypothetical protein [Candidatus Neomarinimicrobiota bacterium]MBT3632526.1 hypothetical protein [Candidatus Neomarinimicrobiota bacterium]MBT3824925.1 hypothetical protein [Candidatus Neomarinimicrobiota bacterium]MBT4132794.1 hypothetical protein [Candidatus Neomarinimicrobiota bacterium]MBT4295284.1 hypothetical protein [Candidatus Neomarinimicrobiota bacterium]